ncbi:MAG TPA: hypothetical protein VGN52_05555 [Burkholderiales bacterium]
MRRLLDFTRSGRWLTITAADSLAAQGGTADSCAATTPSGPKVNLMPPEQARPATDSIRRLMEYTVCGHWHAAGDPPAPSHLNSQEMQQLFDATFFGVEVNEIPAEKWREIAPLFDR